ncbi:hypothetical protein K493DRAFT_320923 [Basidiobolus meristosporus CBS 931.73]|uniref:Arrestin C-terminal-like domain-containing protein n=1 Tax=Basidiobolus meristosporus CBS 931.73 TaxID=1314790 RepID=A0A1Y1X4K8_9FUNG|nr:hypothetical protein K493DRAFT_320923 [Basidiobolus meristosporus CBS 931.73]|eukprot:ORX80254.1 hypothetical protein K493DRAFT_320923 [Basidiobolus meristosporus CBS 931.73]
MTPEKSTSHSVAVVKTSEKYSFIFAPGKQASKNGNVKLNLFFDKPFYNAASQLSGTLELTCVSEELLKLGQVLIEVTGFEDIERDSKNTSLRRRIFYKTRLVLQDQNTPSNAVKANSLPDVDGYYPAKAGKTCFPFTLELSGTLPSSYVSKIGGVRYVVSGAALIKSNAKKENLAHNRFAQVYERWSPSEIEYARLATVSADNSDEVNGETKERISMTAELTKAMVAAGGLIYVKAFVNNMGKKAVSGLRLSLWQHISGNTDLTRVESGGRLATVVDNRVLVTEAVYRGHDWTIPYGESRGLVVALGIPPSCYSLRNTTLIQVSYEIQIDIITSFCKWKPIRLPIYIAHPSSWSDPAPSISFNEMQTFVASRLSQISRPDSFPTSTTVSSTPTISSSPIPLASSIKVNEPNQIPSIPKNPRRVSLLSRKDTIRRKGRPNSVGTVCEPSEKSRMILRVTNPDEAEEPEMLFEPDQRRRLPGSRKRASTVGSHTYPSIAQNLRQSALNGVATIRPTGLRVVSEPLPYVSDTASLIEIGDQILAHHNLRPSFEEPPCIPNTTSVVTPPRRGVTIQQLEELQEKINLTGNPDSDTESNSDDSYESFHDARDGEEEKEAKSTDVPAQIDNNEDWQGWEDKDVRPDQYMYPTVAQEDYYLSENSEFSAVGDEGHFGRKKERRGNTKMLLKKNTKMRVKLSRSDTVASIQKKLARLQHQMDTILTLMDTEPLPNPGKSNSDAARTLST